MGCEHSTSLEDELDPNVVEELRTLWYTENELEHLYMRFKEMDQDQDGFLTREDILLYTVVNPMKRSHYFNPLATNFIRLMENRVAKRKAGTTAAEDEDGFLVKDTFSDSGSFIFQASDCRIDFLAFAECLSPLHVNASRREKQNMLFDLYDVNQDFRIDETDLYVVLSSMFEGALPKQEVWKIAQEVINEGESQTEIDTREFSTLLADLDINEKLSVRF